MTIRDANVVRMDVINYLSRYSSKTRCNRNGGIIVSLIYQLECYNYFASINVAVTSSVADDTENEIFFINTLFAYIKIMLALNK